jgi:predicted transcriptional regulator
MKRSQEIEDEMKELTKRLQDLRVQLDQMQNSCVHEFETDPYSQTCLKCNFTESLYY